MSVVDFVTVRLNWCETGSVHPAPHLLRGAVAQRFPGNSLFHQHEGERVVYRYPQVQYRWDRHGPMMVGLGEGARFLAGVEWSGLELRVGDQYLTIRDAVCDFRRHVVGPSPRLLRYHFVSPWLPLSQENYQRYRSLNATERIAERDRLAVAGILIGLRGFGVDFPGRLYAAFEQQHSHPCHYKGIELCGFRGELLANVDVPDGFAIGRAVSHGYGWLCRNSSVSSGRGADDDISENDVAAD
jgi:Cas6b C-terminal domain/Cas6b N-terminal domain